MNDNTMVEMIRKTNSAEGSPNPEDINLIVQDFFTDINGVLALPGDLSNYKGDSPLVPLIRARVQATAEDLFLNLQENDPDYSDLKRRKEAARQLLDDGEKEVKGGLPEQVGNRILREHMENNHGKDVNQILVDAYKSDEVKAAIDPLLTRLSQAGIISTENNDKITDDDFVNAFWSVLSIGYSRSYIKDLPDNSLLVKMENEKVFKDFYGVVVKEVFIKNQDKLPNLRNLYNEIIHTYNRDLDDQYPEIKKQREFMITRAVMKQTKERVNNATTRLISFLSQFSPDYLKIHGRKLADIYFGVERLNIPDGELATIIQGSESGFVEYFCPPWQWHEELKDSTKTLTNFSIQTQEPEGRVLRLKNLSDFWCYL